MRFSSKKYLILGMGISGRSAAQFLLSHGAIVQGVDRDPNLLMNHPEIQQLKQSGLTVSGETDFKTIQSFDCMVLSPGIPSTHPLIQSAKEINLPIIGEIELGCRVATQPIFGVTGTNGKTTVTMLITHVLQTSGVQAKALGNVGVPLTRELLNFSSENKIILELSSYQLETLHQPCLEAGIILNITPDHLDRYSSLEAYAQAKCGMERAIKPTGRLYMEERAWDEYGHLLNIQRPYLYGYTKNCFIQTDLKAVFQDGKKVVELPESLRNKNSHELENFLAAYALCADQSVADEVFISGWSSFKKPRHRIEFVKEWNGVRYFDDSKGTNIDAVIRAVEVFEGPITLIAGGVDKGSSYVPWIEKFKNKVKLICAIGEAAGKLNEQLSSKFPVVIFTSLDEAVNYAARMAKRGETILLSPGCSSFDMFKDYVHRGNEFQRIVHELVNKSLID